MGGGGDDFVCGGYSSVFFISACTQAETYAQRLGPHQDIDRGIFHGLDGYAEFIRQAVLRLYRSEGNPLFARHHGIIQVFVIDHDRGLVRRIALLPV